VLQAVVAAGRACVDWIAARGRASGNDDGVAGAEVGVGHGIVGTTHGAPLAMAASRWVVLPLRASSVSASEHPLLIDFPAPFALWTLLVQRSPDEVLV